MRETERRELLTIRGAGDAARGASRLFRPGGEANEVQNPEASRQDAEHLDESHRETCDGGGYQASVLICCAAESCSQKCTFFFFQRRCSQKGTFFGKPRKVLFPEKRTPPSLGGAWPKKVALCPVVPKNAPFTRLAPKTQFLNPKNTPRWH